MRQKKPVRKNRLPKTTKVKLSATDQRFTELMGEGYVVPSDGSQNYIEDFHPKAAFRLCAYQGAGNHDLMQFFGIANKTYHRWLQSHPQFRKAVQLGKDIFNTQVIERRMLQRATGFRYKTRKVTVETKVVLDKETGEPIYNEDGTMKTYQNRSVTHEDHFLPPDVKALIYWLKARDPKRWLFRSLDKAVNERQQEQMKNMDLSQLTSDELKAFHSLMGKIQMMEGSVEKEDQDENFGMDDLIDEAMNEMRGVA
jgi:hypothetical protein